MKLSKLRKVVKRAKNRLTEEILSRYYASPLTFSESLYLMRTGKVFIKEVSTKELYDKIRRIEKQGWLEKKVIEDKTFYKLTKSGRIKYLTLKLRKTMHRMGKQATIIIFDIPEEKRTYRNFLRRLLKQMKFTMIQKSVFITPHILPKEFYDLLHEMDLLKFVKVIEGKIRS